MAKTSQKDILARVQDLGEEALQKLSEVPGGSRIVDMANQTKARLDDMQRRIRGLEKLERRVQQLEQQVAALSKTSTPRKPSTARKPTTPKKPPA
jgi:uncharacterized membrane protein YccC